MTKIKTTKKHSGKANNKNDYSEKSKYPTLQLKTESEIALDFATKAYEKFGKIIKSIILFGSSTKQSMTSGSDIDIIILIDDVSVNWDMELIAWYREELGKILQKNPYNIELHINTVKLSTWWDDLLKGDPIVINVLRYGEALIDFAGFFLPLKFLLLNGKIKSTPEAVHGLLQRAPMHFIRSKQNEMNTIEGLYWCMVDSAHAALISANVDPPSPEHLPEYLNETFVLQKKLKPEAIKWYRDLFILHKQISHGNITDLKGVEIDEWQDKTQKFLKEMVRLVKETID